MYKKSYLPIIIALTLFISACQPDPTPLVSDTSQPAANVPMKAEPAQLNPTNPSELKTAPDADKASFDLQFLDTLSAHHNTSIFLSNLALTKAGNPELKTFAQKVVSNQTEEMLELKKLRDELFANKPSALNQKMSGIAVASKTINVKTLDSSDAEKFDSEYIKQMTAHHNGTLLMAKEASEKAENEKIKTFAKALSAAQEAGINQLRELQTAGGK